MDENNRNKLDELLAQALEALEYDPENGDLLKKVETLTKLCISDYSESSATYSNELKAVAEKLKIEKELELKEKELELKEQEQKQNKHNEWWNRGLKFLGIICPAAIGVGMLSSEWIGSYVNRNALPWVSKFKNFD